MATKAGVWIDHKQAIVVLVTDAGKEIKKIALILDSLFGRSVAQSRSARISQKNMLRRTHSKESSKTTAKTTITTSLLLSAEPKQF